MPKLSTSQHIEAIQLEEQASAPATPSAGYRRIFAKNDGMYMVDSTGAETNFTGGSGGGISFSSKLHFGFVSTAPAGTVNAAGGTIGNAASNATERANADTEDLYTVLWDEMDNTILPIQDSSGTPTTRGANAAADFAANKRLPLPDMRGRIPLVADNQGGSSANVVTATEADTLGDVGGTESVSLTEAELASHDHVVSVSWGSGYGYGGASAAVLGGSITTDTAGSGTAHDNVQPFMTVYAYIEL